MTAKENCYKCGKEISLKNIASYRVLANYRLICVDCATADGMIAPPQPPKAPSGPSKKQPQQS